MKEKGWLDPQRKERSKRIKYFGKDEKRKQRNISKTGGKRQDESAVDSAC